MPEVADIFRLHGAAYLARFGRAVLPSHRRALVDLRDCRTAVLGGRLYVCDHCGREHFVYHSCRNRACPKCHGKDTEAWLVARRQELLPVPYFHVVFTVPQTLRDLLRRHQTTLYPVLMRAAAKALIKLAADPHYVGGLIGVMAVLHTWSRTLAYHPHVHCLVPATGVQTDPDGRQRWLPARKNFLVPVKALSKLFRGLFLHRADKALGGLSLPASASKQPWVVYCKPTMRHTDKVLSYLGRYVHRVAITNHRILAVDDRQVTFRYTDGRSRQTRTMTLGAHEFIRRFLQHVLPKGLHKVRYYGLWAPANRGLLRRVQLALGPAEPSQLAEPSADGAEAPSARCALEGSPCPFCRSGNLVYLRRLPPQPRPPP
jgi:hypothetical protein